MGARLRVVLDQLVHVVDPDQAAAAVDLTDGLVATTPSGCTVEAIVPAGSPVQIAGVDEVRTMALSRRELAASWQLGIAPGVGGGLIHAPSMMAPLVRHDRVHDNHQTTVTLWDLRAWDAPETLSRGAVVWYRAMLKRAARHADAIIVPSHALAARLEELAGVSGRVRVIAGAAPHGFAAPADAKKRRAALSLPREYVVLTGSPKTLGEGFHAAVAAGQEAVVLDAPEGSEPMLAEIAAAAGLPERSAHIRGALSRDDRASVFDGASAYVATEEVPAWPWRAVEAMSLGVPVVAVDSGTHRDVIADGGAIVATDSMPDAVADAAGAGAARLRIVGTDRSRAFSWQGSAERVWSLHAEL